MIGTEISFGTQMSQLSAVDQTPYIVDDLQH